MRQEPDTILCCSLTHRKGSNNIISASLVHEILSALTPSCRFCKFGFFNDPKHQPEGSKCSDFNNLQNLCAKLESYIFPISNIFGRWEDGISLECEEEHRGDGFYFLLNQGFSRTEMGNEYYVTS